MAGNPIGIGIVGTGSIAHSHASAYAALPSCYRLLAVHDLDLAKAQAFALKFGVGHLCKDFSELLHREDVELVDLCTPPHLHAKQAAEGLRARVHVLSEKPLARSLRLVDELIAIEKASAGQLFPIFQYRFDPEIQRIIALQEAGLIGPHQVSNIETLWLREDAYFEVPGRGTWQHDLGGALAIHAIHAHDILCRILGMPNRVFARIASRRDDIETEDLATVSFAFPDGSFAHSSTSLTSRLEHSRFCMVFERVSIEGQTDMTQWKQQAWRYLARDPSNQTRIDDLLAELRFEHEQFEAQFLAMHACLRGGQVPPITSQDARNSIELLTAMYFSAHQGIDVELPLSEQHPYYGGWHPLFAAKRQLSKQAKNDADRRSQAASALS